MPAKKRVVVPVHTKEFFTVFIDGACEPVNPGGTASYGLIVKVPASETPILAEGKIVGNGPSYSNNVAEYCGLVAFLEWYVDLPARPRPTAAIRSDSQMLINQMGGLWRVKNGAYVKYYEKAWRLISENDIGGQLYFYWIPREENEEADELSKKPLVAAGIEFKIQTEPEVQNAST